MNVKLPVRDRLILRDGVRAKFYSMAQIFHRSANTLARASILGLALLLSAVGAAVLKLQRSPYVTAQHIAPEQPVPFSHQHHAAGLGLDCRYCHTSVEIRALPEYPHQDLHELPRADMDQRSHAGSGAL